MAKYKIGNTDETWTFLEAYHDASNGDTLEFDIDFWLELNEEESFTIQKHLTFEGTTIENSDDTLTFTNGICGHFIIDDAEVTFHNFWFRPARKGNVIVVKNNGNLTLNNVVFDNVLDDNTYPIVYTFDNVYVHMNNVEVKERENTDFQFELGSEIMLTNSPWFNGNLYLNNAKLTIDNSVITRHTEGNVLKLDNDSELIIKNTSVKNYTSQKNEFPAIWVGNSTINMENCLVNQDEYISSVYLNKRSILHSTNNCISSLRVDDSTVHLNETTIEYTLVMEENSFARSKNHLIFLGSLNDKVDLLVNNHATFISDIVEIKRIKDLNIRLLDNAFVYINEFLNVNGNDGDIRIEKNQMSILIKNKIKTNDTILSDEVLQKEDCLESLNNLIGLYQVKEEVKKMISSVELNRKRLKKGLKPVQQSLHAVFVGNPGTGKTTVARLLGKILYQYGALTSDEFKFVEVSEPDLISNHVGETAKKTLEHLEKARGGILFIDEAYTLDKRYSTNFGKEAIDTIMKYMEDYRDEIMVIFAGYTKEMDEFLETNPGLKSRVPNRFIFDDYTSQEIVKLGEKLLSDAQYTLIDKNYYVKYVTKAYSRSLDNSNGRWIRNFNEQLMKAQASRIIATGSDDVEYITNADIDSVMNNGRYENVGREEDAFEKLNLLVGIPNVKQQVEQFILQAEANQKKEERGMMVDDFVLHSLFLGNPGTGKTTVARIIGKILYQKGIIATNKFVEVSRSDLVAGYIGQTALKTQSILKSALGGVLFIDEAYTLNNELSRGFGHEAINEILKFMEDHRRDIIIIFAGYTKEMNEFLKMNSGLASRIPTTIDFEDYTSDEIVEIGLLNLKQYQMDCDLYASVVKEVYARTNDCSNGRWIRNFNERLIRNQSVRLIKTGNNDLDYITDEDILTMKEGE